MGSDDGRKGSTSVSGMLLLLFGCCSGGFGEGLWWLWWWFEEVCYGKRGAFLRFERGVILWMGILR